MENTLESKAKFFAQYWGQEILTQGFSKPHKIKGSIMDLIYKEDYLELTPLSDITDEDAIQVAKIENNYEDALTRGKVLINTFIKYVDCSHSMKNSLQFINMIDFLRAKGYALPWMGLSVEKQSIYGWVKLNDIKKETSK
jgi:hypothetical protein